MGFSAHLLLFSTRHAERASVYFFPYDPAANKELISVNAAYNGFFVFLST